MAWIVRHEYATFWWRFSVDILEAKGILDGDLIAVDRAGRKCAGRIVLAVVEGAVTIKKLACRDGWTGDPSGNGHAYTKAGVILMIRWPRRTALPCCFRRTGPVMPGRWTRSMRWNDRFGKKTVILGREGFNRGWSTRTELCSPRYTTRISEVPVERV